MQIEGLRLSHPNIKSGDIVLLEVNELSSFSTIKIDVRCDECGVDKNIKIKDYNKNIQNGGYYACSQICAKEKSILTNDKKYGKHPSKISENRNRAVETCKNKYGEDYMKCDIIKSKIVNSNISKYGVEYPLMSKEIREKCEITNLEKYGRKNPFQIEKIKEKIKKTNIIKYGVENPQQCDLIHEKTVRSGYLYGMHISGLTYQGTYEKDFLDTCYNRKIIVKKPDSITYEFDSKLKKYFPDFYYTSLNLIIEIKSSYTYRIDEEINLQKKKAAEQQGFKFIFIIDKQYSEFFNIIS